MTICILYERPVSCDLLIQVFAFWLVKDFTVKPLTALLHILQINRDINVV